MRYKLITIFLFLSLSNYTLSQVKNTHNRDKIEEISKIKNGLNDKIRIDLVGLTLFDFITTLAEEHQLNVSVDSKLNQIVNGNFFDVKIKEVLLFLIKKYNLEFEFENNILSFNKKSVKKEIKKLILEKPIHVKYNERNNFLSVNLKNDSIYKVARAITNASKKNIVFSPEIKNIKISAYILNRPFDQVIDMMTKSNGLISNKDENNNYFLEKDTEKKPFTKGKNSKSRSKYVKGAIGSYSIEIGNSGFINIKAYEADVSDILIEVAEKLNINFFMYDKPSNIKTTLVATDLNFDDLLSNVFKGKKYTFKKTEDFYLIGEHNTQGLRFTELIQLENRSIETVQESLPKSVVEKLEVKEFLELNGFVVSGSKTHIKEFKNYIEEIDIVVPVIQIEVIIVQYQKAYDIQTGIQAGLDQNTRTTSGTLFPTTDVGLNSTSVNSLIDAFNGLGFINLGKVTKDFYLNLNLLENNSIIKTSSTPKLVTLNGHDASSSIGQTSYYFEQNNRLINSGINDNILQSGTWKSTEANLSVNIKPFVSKDEDVTLTISVERSSFLARAGENAPPGKATQKFESMIRVKNNEMILLGGLDELEKEDTGTGTPFISRIPLLKWFFSSKTKRKGKSKLHIFIKPTVTY